MTSYPEPPDGSIVGWGAPLMAVHVRLDDYADLPAGENWFETSAAPEAGPWSWSDLCRLAVDRHYGKPCLLTPTQLPE